MSTELTFTVEVSYTDRTHKAGGGFNERLTTLSIFADTDHEATLTAAQMVDCTIPDAWMVIGTEVTEVFA